MDWNAIAADTLRALRGPRTQRGLSRRLGFSGNVVSNWENGRRFPTFGEFLAACARLGVPVSASIARFQPSASSDERVEGDVAAAAWLERLRAGTPISEIAARTALSRHALRRWFAGETRPRLPDGLRLVDALTGRVSDLLAELVPIDAVPALAELHHQRCAARDLAAGEPWVAAVLRMMETVAFRAVPFQAGWIARRLGISEETERRCLARLREAGVVRLTADGYRTAAPLSVSASPGTALARLKHHWAEQGASRASAPLPDDLISYNVCSLSRADLERLRALHRRYFAEVRALVAASGPPETVALVNVHLIEFPVDAPR